MQWHFVLESLAYLVAFRWYAMARDRSGDFLKADVRWTLIVAAVLGAAIGSKVLYWLEAPGRTAENWNNLLYLFGGKTIVGALAGGTLAVEWVKRRAGIQRRTGDLFAIPIAVGIAIGRVGCFLAGMQDDTYGVATSLPWGVDFGDGIRRHPVQLYETVFALCLTVMLRNIREPRFREGDRFRIFIWSYYGWRLVVDFWKPGIAFGGLTALQWICAAGFLWYLPDVLRAAKTAALPQRMTQQHG